MSDKEMYRIVIRDAAEEYGNTPKANVRDRLLKVIQSCKRKLFILENKYEKLD